MEQISFSLEAPAQLRSADVVEAIMPRLVSAVEPFNLSSRHISASPLRSYDAEVGTSLSFSILPSAIASKGPDATAGRNGVICRVKDLKNSTFIEFPCDRSAFYASLGCAESTGASVGFLRIIVSPFSDLEAVVRAVCADVVDRLLHFPSDFSCCSHYQECSEAGRCVSKNQDFAVGCYYKRNLMTGRNFYAEEKEVVE